MSTVTATVGPGAAHASRSSAKDDLRGLARPDEHEDPAAPGRPAASSTSTAPRSGARPIPPATTTTSPPPSSARRPRPAPVGAEGPARPRRRRSEPGTGPGSPARRHGRCARGGPAAAGAARDRDGRLAHAEGGEHVELARPEGQRVAAPPAPSDKRHRRRSVSCTAADDAVAAPASCGPAPSRALGPAWSPRQRAPARRGRGGASGWPAAARGAAGPPAS